MNKTYAYIRVSTTKQNPKRQYTNISDYAASLQIKLDKTYEDKFTGTQEERPEYGKMKKRVLADLRKGDSVTIIFDSVSRMSRDAESGIKQYFDWYDKGVNLVFLNEHHIDTDTYRRNLPSIPKTDSKIDRVLEALEDYMRELAKDQITEAFKQADKEAKDIKKRVCDGIRDSDKKSGRPEGTHIITSKETSAKAKMRELMGTIKANGKKMTDAEIMQAAGISKGTYYRYKAELQNESNN